VCGDLFARIGRKGSPITLVLARQSLFLQMAHTISLDFLSPLCAETGEKKGQDLRLMRYGDKGLGAAVQQGDKLTAGTPRPCATRKVLVPLKHSIYACALAAETGVSSSDMRADGTAISCWQHVPLGFATGRT
jgi:hypothetical protein